MAVADGCTAAELHFSAKVDAGSVEIACFKLLLLGTFKELWVVHPPCCSPESSAL